MASKVLFAWALAWASEPNEAGDYEQFEYGSLLTTTHTWEDFFNDPDMLLHQLPLMVRRLENAVKEDGAEVKIITWEMVDPPPGWDTPEEEEEYSPWA